MSHDDPIAVRDDDLDGEELGRRLRAMVAGVEPGPDLRRRVAHDLAARRRRIPTAARRPLAAAAAVVVLVGGALALIGGDRPDDVVVADEAPVATAPPPTTVVEDPAWPPVTVGGIVVERPPAPGEDAPPPPEAPAPPPPVDVAPPATVPPCRDSVDPACGEFAWDPAPVVPQAEMRIVAPPEVRAGVPTELLVEVHDPGTQPSFNCAGGLAIDPAPNQGPVLSMAGCVMEPIECPARYGPWTPPAPRGGSASVTIPVTFDQPGSYTVSASTVVPLKCDDVDPYGTPASATIIVQVLP